MKEMKFLNLVINIGIFLFKLYDVLYFILHFNKNRLTIFSICLYIGKEKYETLAKVGKIFALQLANLKNNGIINNNSIHWPIEFFFSGDLEIHIQSSPFIITPLRTTQWCDYRRCAYTKGFII